MAGVLQETISKMTETQIEFICSESNITAEELRTASEEKLDEIYDLLCDIECEETPDEGELSHRGKLAVDLVSLMGNAIAESEGYLDKQDE